MAYITADGIYSFEGFTGDILFHYNLLECSTSPLIAISSHFCSLQTIPFPSLHFLCGGPFQFSVMWTSSFQPSQFPHAPAHAFYKGLTKRFTIQEAYSSLFSLFIFACSLCSDCFFLLQTTVSGLWPLLVMISFSPTVKPLKLCAKK